MDGIVRPAYGHTSGSNANPALARNFAVLLYHGVADPFFSSRDTQRYYERLARDNGGLEKVSDWARLFLVPGMNHCRDGPALDNFDALSAIVHWVEQGKPPDRMQETGIEFPELSSQLCAFPKIPWYKGMGSSKDSINFECR